MFEKNTSKKTAPADIELVALKTFVPSAITINAFLFSRTLLKLDSLSIKDEFKRTPKRIHMNAESKNETEGLISHILDDTWVAVFSYLDVSTLVLMMMSCKRIANLANDDGIREQLYTSKYNHFLKSLCPSRVISFFNERQKLVARLPAQSLLPEPVAFMPEAKQQVYNDSPAGQGFVML